MSSFLISSIHTNRYLYHFNHSFSAGMFSFCFHTDCSGFWRIDDRLCPSIICRKFSYIISLCGTWICTSKSQKHASLYPAGQLLISCRLYHAICAFDRDIHIDNISCFHLLLFRANRNPLFPLCRKESASSDFFSLRVVLDGT